VPKKERNTNQQILSKLQERALMDWICHQASIAMPLNKDGIHSLVFNISGVTARQQPYLKVDLKITDVQLESLMR